MLTQVHSSMKRLDYSVYSFIQKVIIIDEVRRLYSYLWDMYIIENPELLQVLLDASGVSDIFGQKGHQCQATELWRIRQNHLNPLNQILGD